MKKTLLTAFALFVAAAMFAGCDGDDGEIVYVVNTGHLTYDGTSYPLTKGYGDYREYRKTLNWFNITLASAGYNEIDFRSLLCLPNGDQLKTGIYQLYDEDIADLTHTGNIECWLDSGGGYCNSDTDITVINHGNNIYTIEWDTTDRDDETISVTGYYHGAIFFRYNPFN